MQKSLKIVSIVLFSLILFLALFFAFNATSEIKVLAESAPSIQINGTEYVNDVNTNPLQTAIGDALESNEENVVIDLSGEIVIEPIEVIVEGEENTYYKGIEIAPSGTSPKITFRITANTIISRSESNTDFTMFAITNANVVFQTVENATLTIDGNRQNVDKKDETEVPMFLLNASNLTLSGNISLINGMAYRGGCINATSSTISCTGITFEKNRSSNQGGVINLEGGAAEFKNCFFIDNFSGSRAGAIYAELSDIENVDAELTIEDCTFKENGLLDMPYH